MFITVKHENKETSVGLNDQIWLELFAFYYEGIGVAFTGLNYYQLEDLETEARGRLSDFLKKEFSLEDGFCFITDRIWNEVFIF